MSKRTQRAGTAAPNAQPKAAAPAAGGGFPGTQQPAAPTRFVGDAHWGRGGRYIVGADGVRRPATAPAPELPKEA